MVVKSREDKAPASEEYLQYTLYQDVLARKRLAAIVARVSRLAKENSRESLKILDLGCGIGGMTFPLSFLGHTVVGVDVDAASIDDCNRKNTFPNATYKAGDIAEIDLGETFDVIICSEVLEHSPHPEKILGNIRKHLAPGGVGIITIPNGYCPYEIIFSRLFQKIGITTLFHRLPNPLYRALTGSPSPYHSLNIFCGHVQFFTLRRFTELLDGCGFQVLDIGNLSLGLFLDWKWLKPLRRLECQLADHVPHPVAGGWVFVIKSQGET